jgi:hypothetical protein
VFIGTGADGGWKGRYLVDKICLGKFMSSGVLQLSLMQFPGNVIECLESIR